MSRSEFKDYVPLISFSGGVFRAMQELAEKVGGDLTLTFEGMIVIDVVNQYAPDIVVEPADFPYGDVIPGTDHTLVFEF